MVYYPSLLAFGGCLPRIEGRLPAGKRKGIKMVKLRMRRTGCKNHATYRIVAADARSPRDGKFIEILGWYDTAMKENNFKIDLERVEDWLKKGAQPSETVASLIRRARNPQLKPHHAVKAKKAEKKA